jgi:hypothetical protein
VWEDYLLPRLTFNDAARLACTCEVLREVVREHFRHIGSIKMKNLQATLTAFPQAREVTFSWCKDRWRGGDKKALVKWLREGGRGRHLVKVSLCREADSDVVHAALREGALPSLRSVDIILWCEAPRASLTGGLLRDMQELRLSVSPSKDWEAQLTALGLMRQLPALAKLEFILSTSVGATIPGPVQWPPFIPPSLKALSMTLSDELTSLSLLRALPGMLEASGAGLERLKIHIPLFLQEGRR